MNIPHGQSFEKKTQQVPMTPLMNVIQQDSLYNSTQHAKEKYDSLSGYSPYPQRILSTKCDSVVTSSLQKRGKSLNVRKQNMMKVAISQQSQRPKQIEKRSSEGTGSIVFKNSVTSHPLNSMRTQDQITNE